MRPIQIFFKKFWQAVFEKKLSVCTVVNLYSFLPLLSSVLYSLQSVQMDACTVICLNMQCCLFSCLSIYWGVCSVVQLYSLLTVFRNLSVQSPFFTVIDLLSFLPVLSSGNLFKVEVLKYRLSWSGLRSRSRQGAAFLPGAGAASGRVSSDSGSGLKTKQDANMFSSVPTTELSTPPPLTVQVTPR